MDASGEKGIEAIAALQQILGTDSGLTVIHEGGHVWRAYFTFNGPTSDSHVEAIMGPSRIVVPHAYRTFLTHYDGALLYADREYGQWGFRLYGTADLASANMRWQQRYANTWQASYIAIAESYGDGDLIVLDVSRPTSDGCDCVVLDGDSGYMPGKWKVLAPSFGDWIDRLVVAQGTKYWRWA